MRGLGRLELRLGFGDHLLGLRRAADRLADRTGHVLPGRAEVECTRRLGEPGCSPNHSVVPTGTTPTESRVMNDPETETPMVVPAGRERRRAGRVAATA